MNGYGKSTSLGHTIIKAFRQGTRRRSQKIENSRGEKRAATALRFPEFGCSSIPVKSLPGGKLPTALTQRSGRPTETGCPRSAFLVPLPQKNPNPSARLPARQARARVRKALLALKSGEEACLRVRDTGRSGTVSTFRFLPEVLPASVSRARHTPELYTICRTANNPAAMKSGASKPAQTWQTSANRRLHRRMYDAALLTSVSTRT